MRKLLLLIFFSLSSYTFTQTLLEGEFNLVQEKYLIYLETDSYIFKKDSSFDYFVFTDYGKFYGKGKYHINKSEITLKYENVIVNQDTIVNKYEVLKDSATDDDSIQYKFLIKDYKNKPIEYSGLSFYDTNWNDLKFANGKPILINMDSNGFAQLKFGKNQVPLIIRVFYMGFPLIIYIFDDYNKEFLIILYRYFGEWNNVEHKKEKFKIRNVSEKEFYIKDPYKEYWKHYVKKTK